MSNPNWDNSFDPNSPFPQRPQGRNPATVVLTVLGVGAVLFFLSIAGLAALWWSRGAERLPAREEETFAEKYEKVAEAFESDTLGEDEEEVAEIRTMFTAFCAKCQGRGNRDFSEFFDAQRMFQEIRRLGPIPGLSRGQEKEFIGGMSQGISKAMVQNADLYGFVRFEIKRCDFLDAPGEALVYIRFYGADDMTTKWRWWLRKGGGQWRFYDFEELGTSLRVSDNMYAMLQNSSLRPDEIRLSQMNMAVFADACRAIMAEDWETADRLLKQVDFSNSIDGHKALLEMMKGVVHGGYGRWDQALECLDSAESFRDDMPGLMLIRATALNQLGRFDEAKEQAEGYLELLGSDPEAYINLGTSLRGLGSVP